MLPPNLNHVGGDLIFSDNEPASLIEDARQAKSNGIIKGNVWCLITVTKENIPGE